MQVHVWVLPNSGMTLADYTALDSLATFHPYGSESCSTVLWLSSTVLVTGNENNSIIKLWHVTQTAVCLQTLAFTDTRESSNPSFFNHMEVQAATGLVILANSRQLAVYTLHFSGADDAVRFDYLANFSVSQPIMSFAVHYSPSESPAALHLYCTQPMAIQNYTLNPALCRPSGLPDTASTLPHTPAVTSARSQQPATVAQPQLLSQQAEKALPVRGLPSGRQSPSLSSQPPSIRTVPQPPSPAGPAEQPRLLTPTALRQQAKGSMLASLMSQDTPTSTSRGAADNSDAVSTASTQGSKLQEQSVSRQQSAETIPSSAAALDASISASYDSSTASVAEGRADTPPPSMPAMPAAAYLTPEQYNSRRETSEALQSTASQSDLRLDLVNKPGTSDQVSVKLLRRQEGEAAAAGPSQPPIASPSAVFSQPLDLLSVADATRSPQPSLAEAAQHSDGADRQPEPASGSVDSSVGLLGSSSELSEASVKRIADAVAERTLGQHKRVLSYLNDGHREMLRIIKADISKEGKRLQLAVDAQVRPCTSHMLSHVLTAWHDLRMAVTEDTTCAAAELKLMLRCSIIQPVAGNLL